MNIDRVGLVSAQYTNEIPNGKQGMLLDLVKLIPDDKYPIAMSCQVKSTPVALILSIILGFFGIDRFYLGDIGMGIAKLIVGLSVLWLTIFSFIWSTIDIYFVYKRVKEINFVNLCTFMSGLIVDAPQEATQEDPIQESTQVIQEDTHCELM